MGLPLPFGLRELRLTLECCLCAAHGWLGGRPSPPGKTGAAVELAALWLAEGPCCSVIRSTGAREGFYPSTIPLLGVLPISCNQSSKLRNALFWWWLQISLLICLPGRDMLPLGRQVGRITQQRLNPNIKSKCAFNIVIQGPKESWNRVSH